MGSHFGVAILFLKAGLKEANATLLEVHIIVDVSKLPASRFPLKVLQNKSTKSTLINFSYNNNTIIIITALLSIEAMGMNFWMGRIRLQHRYLFTPNNCNNT